MSDHERFGKMISLMATIGAEVQEAHIYADQYILVEGVLPDGRKVSLTAEGKVTNAE